MDPEDALLEAALNAASAVSVIDTTAGLLGRDELARRRASATVSRALKIG